MPTPKCVMVDETPEKWAKDRKRKKNCGPSLPTYVRMLPTPGAIEGGPMPELAHEPKINQRNYSKKTGIHCQMTLRRHAELWPTPRAGNPGSRPNQKGGKILAEEVKKSVGLLPTMTACEWKGRGPNSKQQGLTNKIGCTGGQLNPTWVEWLMGYPLGYTDLKG